MFYPGDVVTLTLPLENPDGSAPVIGYVPAVIVLNALTGAQAVSPAVTMTLLPGTSCIYTCGIPTAGLAAGSYVAVASYQFNGTVFQNKFLAAFQLGDTYVTGPVALDSTVAKNATVAKDATVMHLSDFVAPDLSPAVLQILNKVTAFPASIPSSADLAAVASTLTDVWDYSLGTWAVDKNTNIFTLYRVNGARLASFHLQNATGQTLRSRQQ